MEKYTGLSPMYLTNILISSSMSVMIMFSIASPPQ
nr:MAG TPA: hypothetical protein [Caudoviricetes sp.]